ncbi:hypothetical protein OF83DRAFT_829729 [Amylostereum chailletii]|nr:hypothetical protein OF83DRAFT_829729 [Amylostereum chailletii]
MVKARSMLKGRRLLRSDPSDLDELTSASPSPPVQAASSSRQAATSASKGGANNRLKITLKLPTAPQRGKRKRVESSASEPPSRDIESEDEDEAQGSDGGDEDESRSASAMGDPGRMTARQAVLASVVDSSHVSLDSSSRKKKELNETELALRREETARKRKHMSEKKLEDEKAETINRLLKKQSRPRNKRNALATADDRTPGTPNEGEGDEEVIVDAVTEILAPVPTFYRWISTSRPPPSSASNTSERHMQLSFSVPVAAFPDPSSVEMRMDVDDTPGRTKGRETPRCDVEGCAGVRKYRLVRDWTRGACGMDHLRSLERAATVS